MPAAVLTWWHIFRPTMEKRGTLTPKCILKTHVAPDNNNIQQQWITCNKKIMVLAIFQNNNLKKNEYQTCLGFIPLIRRLMLEWLIKTWALPVSLECLWRFSLSCTATAECITACECKLKLNQKHFKWCKSTALLLCHFFLLLGFCTHCLFSSSRHSSWKL